MCCESVSKTEECGRGAWSAGPLSVLWPGLCLDFSFLLFFVCVVLVPFVSLFLVLFVSVCVSLTFLVCACCCAVSVCSSVGLDDPDMPFSCDLTCNCCGFGLVCFLAGLSEGGEDPRLGQASFPLALLPLLLLLLSLLSLLLLLLLLELNR